MVEEMVIIAELPNDRQKFIFLMASGKFFSVNPCAPRSDSGSDVMSAFVLKTLIMTMMNGKMNAKNITIRITSMMACEIRLLRAAA